MHSTLHIIIKPLHVYIYENVQIGGVTQTKHVCIYMHITDRPTHTHTYMVSAGAKCCRKKAKLRQVSLSAVLSCTHPIPS